ncbi:MAG: peptidase [Acidobacteriaceae bacterium]|jgi:putative proteasome-type protease|nr:peptidase [Acidobacteriaceae bacterium]
MTYCLGIMTREGLVMASDSRTNAGYDQVNVCRKMHTFVLPGERAFVLLTSGSLSLTQSTITLLQDDFQQGRGLALAESMYMAARVVGDAVRRVSDLDRAALERDDYNFNIHLLLGGQVKGGPSALYCIYPQGNPLSATQDSPYLQIGEVKYGRPILDRGIVYDETSLDVAALYAMLSFDATIRSNVTVGPPLELLVYRDGALDLTEYRRFSADDPELLDLHSRWEATLRRAVEDLPRLRYTDRPTAVQQPLMETAARP